MALMRIRVGARHAQLCAVLAVFAAGCAAPGETDAPESAPLEERAAGAPGPETPEPSADAEPVVLPEPFEQTLPGGAVTIEMVPVPGGTLLTADGPVEIEPFLIARFELPWEAYDVFLHRLDLPPEQTDADAETRPSKPYINMDRGFGHNGYPAISMSHHGAAMFCRWLSQASEHTFRLPSEHEWQWAALAGSPGPWLTGADPAGLEDQAWMRSNADFKTHPVGEKAPNALGLHDMSGNAAEWVTAADGRPLVYGGSYRDPAEKLRLDAHVEPVPDWNASDPQIPKSVWWLADAGFIGFRVVCDP